MKPLLQSMTVGKAGSENETETEILVETNFATLNTAGTTMRLTRVAELETTVGSLETRSGIGIGVRIGIETRNRGHHGCQDLPEYIHLPRTVLGNRQPPGNLATVTHSKVLKAVVLITRKVKRSRVMRRVEGPGRIIKITRSLTIGGMFLIAKTSEFCTRA